MVLLLVGGVVDSGAGALVVAFVISVFKVPRLKVLLVSFIVVQFLASDAILNAVFISSELMPVVDALLDADMIIFPSVICY